MAYRYATLVRLTMDDPRNEDMNEGTEFLAAGKHEDGYSYNVIGDEDLVTVECETVGVVGPSDCPATSY